MTARSAPAPGKAVRRVLVLVCALLSPAAAAPLPGATEIQGRQVPLLTRRAPASVRAYAFRDGKAVAIPVQVDERDPKNRWTTEEGPEPLRDVPPRSIDSNDAIVVMNRDLGDRGTLEKLPPSPQKWVEVRVGEAAKPLGYYYLSAFDDPPKPSPVDYCRYDPRADRVSTERYDVTFAAPLPTRLAFVDSLGAAGENVLEAVHASGEVRFFGGVFTLRRSEKDILYELEGWRDGPVRVVRGATYWIPLPLGFRARARVFLLFHRDFVEARSNIRVRIPPRLVPAQGELIAAFDFARQNGARVLAADGTIGDPVDGVMSDSEKRLDGRSSTWAALLLGGGKTFLLAVRREGSLKTLRQEIRYREAPGQPTFGFELGDLNRLETGEHELAVTAMILDVDSPDEVTAVAKRLVAPPPVLVTPLAASVR